MLFNSLEFFLFLGLALIVFYLLPKTRLYLIVVADVLFYGLFGLQYLFLFLLMTTLIYLCALKTASSRSRFFFWAGLLTAVLNLIFFKYTGFILNNVRYLFHLQIPWDGAFLAHIALPVGISFYTFQLISYLVDVKRGKIAPCRSFLDFWVFVSFFSHVIAGPILRGHVFLPQLRDFNKKKILPEHIKYGLYYILFGLVKKIVFADTLAPKVDYYFSQAAALNSLDAWFAAYLFAFQIYFDFSAYSDIAVGVGRLFGLRLPFNFKTPYLSGNATEFWKRWHITLSSWIKDYIYIPLGGSRKGLALQILFIIVSMTVSGIWHGAAWTFVAWGLYYGLLIAGHKLYLTWLTKTQPAFGRSLAGRIVSVIIFFQVTAIGWVLFRAKNFSDAAGMIWKMVSFSQLSLQKSYVLYFGFILFLYALHIIEHYLISNKVVLANWWESHFPPYVRAAVYTVVIFLLILFTKTAKSTFIYLQF